MHDLRFAFRQLVRQPIFGLTAIFALALGIGATTAIFGIIDGFLLRPLPYAQPDQLVTLQSRSTRSGSDLGVNYLDFQDWQKQARSFSEMAFFNLRWNGNLETRDGVTETLKTTFTTANLFHLLGVQPLLGRDLTTADDEIGAPKVILISHRLWSALGSDPRMIGRELRFDGDLCTVVGVMPPGFRFPVQSDIWVPMASVFGKGTNRSWRADQAAARLKPGVSLAEAQSEMNVIAQRLARQFPETNADIGAKVIGLRENSVGDLRASLLLLFAACGGVLLIACANVSQLLLARATTRRGELAVRSALGASRRRLVRQLLTESALLGILGSVLGAVLAFWLVDFANASIPVELPFWVKIEVNGGVLLFAAAVSLLSGIIAGVLPAWQATRVETTPALQSTRSTSAGGRTRQILTVAQVSVSIVLLAGASMLLRGVMKAREIDPGFDPRQTLLMEVNPTYRSAETAQVRVDRFARLLERLREIPGVENAAANNSPPFVPQRPWNRIAVVAEGQPIEEQRRMPPANFQTVSPEYFRLLRIPLIAGRVFEAGDNLTALPVCLISERLAKSLWPNESALGHRVQFASEDAEPAWMTVIGVVGDVRHQNLERAPGPDFYKCSLQLAWKQMHFLVRARPGIEPLGLIAAIRAQVTAAAPGTGVFNFVSLEREVGNSLWQARLQSWLLGFFSIVALALAVAGLYGAMAYGVAQRTREIGIRMALGATRRAVLGMMLRQSLSAVALGILLGVSAAFFCARALRAASLANGADDFSNCSIACVLLASAAAVACYFPARKATRIDPMVALRHE